MSSNDNELFKYTQLTASALINSDLVRFGGIFCSSSSGGSVTIYDGTSASGIKVVDTFIPSAGVNYAFPANLKSGCYIAISGTCSITAFWN